MAINSVILRSEIERHRSGKGDGQVSHKVQGPRVLPALGEYATGIAAAMKGFYDVGQGIREVGKSMRSMNGKMGQMKAENAQIDKENAKLDMAAEFAPESADAFLSQKRSRATFGSYW